MQLKHTVGAYLIASYLYYECDYSVMEDTDYDKLCQHLLKYYDKLSTTHPHGNLLDRDALAAGTGHHITPGKYPVMVKAISHTIMEYDRMGRDYLAELAEMEGNQ